LIGEEKVMGKRKGLIQGIGKNDTKYPSFCGGKVTREYNLWRIMLHRCSNKHRATNKAYADVSCSENFKSYTFFYEWCQKQKGFNSKDEIGARKTWHLDKDILVRGNKIYSEDTCVFVPQRINKLLIKSNSARGDQIIGVYWSKRRCVFVAQCSNSDDKHKHIGHFGTQQEAFQAYKTFKEALIKQVANEYKDQLDLRVYEALMNYEVNRND